MHDFTYRRGALHAEEVPVRDLADRFGTPLYVYSARTVREHYRRLRQAFAATDALPAPPLVCYSVKANGNLTLLGLIAQEGGGFDVVSGGELVRVLRAGGAPDRIVFAGVGKTRDEMALALDAGILLFNVESEAELRVLDELAAGRGRKAPVALRVNPDVDPDTHVYIATGKKETKFGIDLERARSILQRRDEFKHVAWKGLHVHIGSQITSTEPYVETLRRVLDFLPVCRSLGFSPEVLNIGGGFGIWYREKLAPSAQEIADALLPLLVESRCRILLEPGRFLVGNAGILLTRVLYVKDLGQRRIAICDAGMNDFIRPALYGAYHRVWPVATGDPSHEGEPPDEDRWPGARVPTDVVGPVCETGDFIARERPLPPVSAGDLLAVFGAGAYGAVMASNYNARPRPAEVVVSGEAAHLTVRRETAQDLVGRETIVPLGQEPSQAVGPGPAPAEGRTAISTRPNRRDIR